MLGVGRVGRLGALGVGRALTTPYVSTTSLQFTGTSSQYCSMADNAAHDFSTAATISLWVKGANSTDFAGLVVKGHYAGSPGLAYTVKRSGADAGKIGIIISDDGTNYRDVSTSINVFDNSWHHAVIVYSAGTLTFYVDGVVDSSPTVHISATVNSLNNASDGLRFGSQLNDATPANFYTGYLNNVSVWNVAMNATQVGELRSSSKPADLSAHSLFSSNCKGWWKCGDGDTIAAGGILDSSGGGFHMTPTNTPVIASDAP